MVLQKRGTNRTAACPVKGVCDLSDSGEFYIATGEGAGVVALSACAVQAQPDDSLIAIQD